MIQAILRLSVGFARQFAFGRVYGEDRTIRRRGGTALHAAALIFVVAIFQRTVDRRCLCGRECAGWVADHYLIRFRFHAHARDDVPVAFGAFKGANEAFRQRFEGAPAADKKDVIRFLFHAKTCPGFHHRFLALRRLVDVGRSVGDA